MDIVELNKISPLRTFESGIDGGLGKGNLGVIVSKHGVGKTACLVHIATDKLMRKENVIHVSFSGNVEHVMSWYKEIFGGISSRRALEDSTEVFEDLLTNRVVMNFAQETMDIDKILGSLKSLIQQGAFKADAVLFDGYKLTVASEEDVKKIKAFAQDLNIEVWFSVSPVRVDVEFDEYGIPNTIESYKDLIDVLVGLKYSDNKDRVILSVVKSHDRQDSERMQVFLDPKSMLISTK